MHQEPSCGYSRIKSPFLKKELPTAAEAAAQPSRAAGKEGVPSRPKALKPRSSALGGSLPDHAPGVPGGLRAEARGSCPSPCRH